MASRSQEPPTTTAPAPKGKTSKPVAQDTQSTVASAPKSRTTKTATKDTVETAKPAPKTRATKAATADAPTAGKSTAPSEKTTMTAAAAPAATRPATETKSSRTQSALEATVKAADPKKAISDELRAEWIAEAAYFIAQRRGFAGGSADDDWREAEKEIDQMLASTRH